MQPHTEVEPKTLSLPESSWQLLWRMRWPLGAAVALALALGRLLETMLLGNVSSQRLLLLDVLGWGLLGGLAVWLSLTWAAHREQRYRVSLLSAIREQAELSHQLHRAQAQLALLCRVNRYIGESATLDQVLDAALAFPRQVVPARAAALVLLHDREEVVARTWGTSPHELAAWRVRFGIALHLAEDHHLKQLTGRPGRCLFIPLRNEMTTIGWIALYMHDPVALTDDERQILQAVAAELAEALDASSGPADHHAAMQLARGYATI